MTARRLDPHDLAPADLLDSLAQDAAPKRRGGWPGPAKPKWTFRPTPEAQAAVEAHLDAEGLDPERDRSKAINALLTRTAMTTAEESQ